MKKHDIPKHILEQVENELLSDEELLWVGQPHPLRFISVVSSRVHPILAFALGLEIAVLVATAVFAPLVLSILLLILLLLTATLGSFAQHMYWANKTIYAISNQRAIIIRDNQVETFGKRDLGSLVKKTRANGRGDIIFRTDSETRVLPSAYGLMLHRQEETERGFLGIENPNHVELLLLNTFADKQINSQRLEDKDVVYDNDSAYLEDEQYKSAYVNR